MHRFLVLLLAFLFLTCSKVKNDLVGSANVDSINLKPIPEEIDFNFHVKPILSDRCFKCHGPDRNKIEAGLSLASFEQATMALGEQKDHHALVPGNIEKSTLVERIYSEEADRVMPPPNSNLKLSSREKTILKKWVAQGAKWKKHWAFLPLSEKMPEKGIDAHINEKIKTKGLVSNPIASKERLIRRLSFDLRGFAPSSNEIDSFLADNSSDAYDKLIDQFMASDAFAETLTMEWMDIARYADTHGYQDDLERVMWPWRDWVIHAFKKNMPYNQFVTWQLAGDLLPNPTKEQIVATAFNRNHSITQEGGVISEEYRVEYVADRTHTVGKAFLGLTMECARCHDHKYDPISKEDYYSLFSFFNSIPEKGLIEPYGAIPEPYIKLTGEDIAGSLSFIKNWDSLENIPLMIMKELPNPRPTFVLNRGAYDQPTTPVYPSTPKGLSDFSEFEKNRKGFSDWLFHKNNPLTARVTINRYWQLFFGQGIVRKPDDFGAQGALPSHPELLDHLAIKLVKDKWDIRKSIKYMLSSDAYKRSSKMNQQSLEQDPTNIYLSRSVRRRLSAEKIRDHILNSSGIMVNKLGGPSVKPYQPKGLWAEKVGGGGGSTAKYEMDSGDDLYRRSLYTFWKRTVPPPNMLTFDANSRDLCMVKRESTSTPLQALVMMNNPEILTASRAMAKVAFRNKEDLESRINWMFRQATSRNPNANEMRELSHFFSQLKTKYTDNLTEAKDVFSEGSNEQEIIEMAAYTLLANTILNLDESISVS